MSIARALSLYLFEKPVLELSAGEPLEEGLAELLQAGELPVRGDLGAVLAGVLLAVRQDPELTAACRISAAVSAGNAEESAPLAANWSLRASRLCRVYLSRTASSIYVPQ